MFCLVMVQALFAQPRDLFAEFEAEEAAKEAPAKEFPGAEANSSAEQVRSSSSPISSSSVVKAKTVSSSSSAAKLISSSSAIPQSSATSSSSVALSSSQEPAVSSAAESSSSEELSSSSMSVEDSYAEAVAENASQVAKDSVSDSTVLDSNIVAPADRGPVAASEPAVESSSSVLPSSSSMSRREILGAVKVSKVNGMDEMKGRYKSPRKAMFMSMLVPGSGQFYVGGETFTFVRGGIYLALEAAMWGSWYYYSVYKYDKQVDRYKKFAKKNYSIGRYENEMRDLYNANAEFGAEFRSRYLTSRESFCEAIYGNAKARGCFASDKIYLNDEGFKSDFVNKPQSLGAEMDKVDFYNSSDMFALIASDAYVLGWKDAEPVAASDLGLEDPNSLTVRLGVSSSLDEYRSLRSKANDYADMQAWFFGGLILNHIVSAIDAALTANAHNKALYQEDLSWYDNLHFDSGFSFNEGFGVNVQAYWGF